MRALEQQMQQQTNQHTLEKAALMDTISKQSTYINDLEVSNQQLQKHNVLQRSREAQNMAQVARRPDAHQAQIRGAN